ncbi:retrotransposon protein, putative, unclassified [Tanacetum coccineum]
MHFGRSYQPTTVTIPVVPATENSLEVPERTTVETILTMSPENKDHYESEKEAIHLILIGIGDEIYSTIDACKTAHEMWEAIERLQHEWSRFVTIVKQQHKLDEVSYHKFFDILKQYQKEVNKLRAERIAKNANPLALVATAQPHQDPYYQTSKSYKSYAPTSKASLPTRSHATTRHKGKEIAKPITPPSESPSDEDSDPGQAQKDKEMQKNLALIAKYFKKLYKPTNNNLRTSSNTRNKNVDTTPRYKNDNQIEQFGNQRAVNVAGTRDTECRKPKRVKDSMYHKEKMLLCKQAEKGVYLQAEQSDWLADTDEEINEQELEANYSYMAKIQEVPNADLGTDSEPLEQVQYDTGYNVFANEIQHSEQSESISNTCVVETGDSNVIPDSPDMCDNDIQNDQNAIECDDERVALANLIANLKLDVDENKKIQKQLKKANASLTQELKECKSTLAETSRTLGESNSIRAGFPENPGKYIRIESSTQHSSVNEFVVINIPEEDIEPKQIILDPDDQPMWESAKTVAPTPNSAIIQLDVDDNFVINSTHVNMIRENKFDGYMRADPHDHIREFLAIYKFQDQENSQDNFSFGRLYLIVFVLVRNIKDVVIGLPKLKYVKDQLCCSCEVSKAKRSSFKSKTVPSSKGRLILLHMDLCGLMRVASINGKKYILVIVDDYSRYTWTFFLRSKVETPEVLKDFLTMIQRNLQALVISVRTDRGTEFDEIKEMSETSVANDTSGLVPQRQKASDYDNPDPAPELQNVSLSADTTVPSQQDLDIFFGHLYDEFFNDGTSRVNKSSSPTDDSAKQDTLHSTNIHPTTVPSTPTNVLYSEYRYGQKITRYLVVGNPFQASAKQMTTCPTDHEMFARLEAVRDFCEYAAPKRLFQFIRCYHAGCVDTHKSTSRGTQFLGDKLVIWISKKQDCIAMSSAEAEYVALSASCAQGRMPTKIELTLEQSQQGVSNDVLETFRGYSLVVIMRNGNPSNVIIKQHYGRIHKDGDGDALFQLNSDSLPHAHAHAQTTKAYYKHRDSRIMKAQELKTKTSA